MKVYQIRIKLYLLKDIMAQDVQIMLTRFIDKSLFAKENLGKLHNTNTYKNYCYDLLSPLEKDKIYKKGKIYTLTIRTIDEDMAEFFYEVCPNINTREFKGLTAEKRVLPRKIIEFIYTLTPMIIKAENGYWKNCMSQEEFEQRFIINLTKKINNFKGDINDKDEINME
ncbi:CRISPR-associated endoribonuclease Cas6, partial [Megamonas funiformis]